MEIPVVHCWFVKLTVVGLFWVSHRTVLHQRLVPHRAFTQNFRFITNGSHNTWIKNRKQQKQSRALCLFCFLLLRRKYFIIIIYAVDHYVCAQIEGKWISFDIDSQNKMHKRQREKKTKHLQRNDTAWSSDWTRIWRTKTENTKKLIAIHEDQ